MFSWYTLVQGRMLDAATAFTALAWISQLRWSINALPGIYTVAAMIRPSAERLALALFEDPHLCRAAVAEQARPGNGARAAGGTSHDVSIAIHGGKMCYSSGARLDGGSEECERARDEEEKVGLLADVCGAEEEVVVLQGVDLVLKRGQFLIICGEVGAGKSTLLASLALAQPLSEGKVEVHGSRAYANQKAFVMTGSIRDNILFQLPWEPRRYREALERAALLPDLASMPEGDRTLVGPEGVQLSGGQRARVALARVLYADADVVLLDDVMSALDAETGAKVWAGAICWMKARGKTVRLPLFLLPKNAS